jgi:hypothetical protein
LNRRNRCRYKNGDNWWKPASDDDDDDRRPPRWPGG